MVVVGEHFHRAGGHRVHVARGAQEAVPPSSITSGTPPTREAMGTTSQAIASSAASPNDSISLGSSITSAMASFS